MQAFCLTHEDPVSLFHRHAASTDGTVGSGDDGLLDALIAKDMPAQEHLRQSSLE